MWFLDDDDILDLEVLECVFDKLNTEIETSVPDFQILDKIIL